MRYNKRVIRIVMAWWVAMLVGILLCMLISLSGCKTIREEVPVIVEHTTHEKSVELRVDTIFHRDSTIVLLQGDTLVERHYNTIYKVREVQRTDTLRDTIPQVTQVKVTEVQEVNRLHWWQTALMWFGIVAAVVVASCIGFIFWRIRK